MVCQSDYDIFGNLRNRKGIRDFIPFRQLGQYEDDETGLYYNRFRYYDPRTGNYISQDPIRLAGNNPTMYGYVSEPNRWVDIFGLQLHHIIPQAVWKNINRTYYSASRDRERKDRMC
ncbi:RHS repeat-associated core domain-containing protein [Prevotella intermedia]|uniref:RHS repeat-associated core domain-containing protein n=1 Tax=Prevotella intermedia TaxID=28131 RepID=UPI00397BB76A